MKKTILFLPLFLTVQIFAQEGLRTRSVTVFKNNQSFFVKNGEVASPNGRYRNIGKLPEARFGTFWFSSPTGEIKTILAFRDTLKTMKMRPNVTPFQILKANIGREIKLDSTTATIERVDSLYYSEGEHRSNRYEETVWLRKKNGNWITRHVGQMGNIEFLLKPNLEDEQLRTSVRDALEIRFSTTKPSQPLDLMYLENGMNWAPIYQLSLDGKKKGSLSLRADLINDAEPIDSTVEVRLAVGIPNFQFSRDMDWLVHFQLKELTDLYAQQNFQNYQSQNFNFGMNISMNATGRIGGKLEDQPEFQGDRAEEYFFYKIKPGSLPKGARMQVPIFEAEVETEHFFECDLNTPPVLQRDRSNDYLARKLERENPVHHFVKFKNTNNFPFTTGPVTITSQSNGGKQPISQDLLSYTAMGGESKIRIAESSEIKVNQFEGVTERVPNSLVFWTRHYALYKVEGQVSVKNYKDEPVKLTLRRLIVGHLKNSGSPWKTEQEFANISVNKSNIVEWNIELKPGEEKEFKYKYEVYDEE